MRTIKVYFANFWSQFYEQPREYIFVKALEKLGPVEICSNSEEADYVFFSLFHRNQDSIVRLSGRAISIFYTGENIVPDFNEFDYALGFERMIYGDRYMRLPNNYISPLFQKTTLLAQQKHQLQLPQKKAFCSFVASNSEYTDSHRLNLLHAINCYKQVDCGGKIENNVGGPVKDKLDFDRYHKFSLVTENSRHVGYTTEKIWEAFAAQTIPIYWGDPEVMKTFNHKAFINVDDYENTDALLRRIADVDCDEQLYKSMLAEPALLHPKQDSYEAMFETLVSFFRNIVDSTPDNAKRIQPCKMSAGYLAMMRNERNYPEEISLRSRLADMFKLMF